MSEKEKEQEKEKEKEKEQEKQQEKEQNLFVGKRIIKIEEVASQLSGRENMLSPFSEAELFNTINDEFIKNQNIKVETATNFIEDISKVETATKFIEEISTNFTYKTIDVMLDLETLGLSDNIVITQLSAVAFDINTGLILDQFNMDINIRSCIQKGLKIDGSSVEWWFKQDIQVFNDVFVRALNSENSIDQVLTKFNEWSLQLKDKYKSTSLNIWGNGADNKWIRQAYKVCNIEPCWFYYEDRDLRTLVELGHRLYKISIKNIVFDGQKHNALDDCKHQIKYCCEIYNNLRNF